MSSEFIHPNWHVLLIHYPLGLLAIGFLIEVFSFLWRRSTFRTAGRWMIFIGALSCVPTATSGIYAFRDVVAPHTGDVENDETWIDVKKASTWNDVQWELMVDHLRLAAFGTLVVVASVCTWFAASDRWRERLYWPAMVGLVIGLGLLASAAWHSGEAVYTQATGVERETPSAVPPATQAGHRIAYYVPPLQLHTILAGTVVALALAALSITVRRWNQLSPTTTEEEADRYIRESVGGTVAHRPATPVAQTTDASLTPAHPRLYPGRFWLVTFVLAVLTALGGLWVSEDFDLKMIREMFSDSEVRSGNIRLFVHVLLGSSLVVLTFVLAGLTRLTPRWRVPTIAVSLLLILAAAGQVYVGTLMTFDSMQGSLMHFNRAEGGESAPTTQSATQPAQP